jgi:FtsX-like permease family protein
VTAPWWLTRRHVRRQRAGAVAIALIVTLGGAGTVLAVETAQRTSTAFPRYLERADVGDLLINPSLFTAEIDEVIRGLPGAGTVTSDSLFMAAIDDDGAPTRHSQSAAVNTLEAVLGSVDGRYTTMDRLAYRHGRAPTGPREAVVSVELAAARGLEVGDAVPVSFWRAQDDVRSYYLGDDPLMTPVGVERLAVVGIATFPGEVLPDDLYPRGRMVVSPDVAARYDCLPPEPARDATLEEAAIVMVPRDCSVLYRLYSLKMEGGTPAVEAAQEAFVHAAGQRNAALPPALVDDAKTPYILIATTTAEERDRVHRSMQPTTTALAVLGAAAGTITAAVAGVAMARLLRRSRQEQTTWWRLGLPTGERTAVGVVPLLLGVGLGMVAAPAVAWWSSPAGPLGSARAIDPSPGRGLGGPAWLALLTLGVVLGSATLALAWRAARATARTAPFDRHPGPAPRFVRWTGRPDVAEGLRAAWSVGRGGGLVIAGGAIAVSVLVAALVFGASLVKLLDTPAWYGWPWDAANLVGRGYVGVDIDAATATLGDRDDIERWAGLGYWQSLTVNGVAVPTLVSYPEPHDVDLEVIDGRLPVAPDEVALGSRFAAERALGVGDDVTLAGEHVVVDQAEVTGIVVLPSLGPIESDRTTPGYGMLLPAGTLDADRAALLMSFVGLEVSAGADPEDVLATLHDDFQEWDMFRAPLSYVEPVRPPEIINAQSMRVVPAVVAGLVTVAAGVGLGASIVASVSARQHDIGILRALGFTARQVRNSITVQSIATVLTALAVGLPLGVIAGRYAWRTFADRLGVVATPAVPMIAITLTIGGAIAVGLLASLLPARKAAGNSPATALRSD